MLTTCLQVLDTVFISTGVLVEEYDPFTAACLSRLPLPASDKGDLHKIEHLFSSPGEGGQCMLVGTTADG